MAATPLASAQEKSTPSKSTPVLADTSAAPLSAPAVETAALLRLRHWKSSFKNLGVSSPLTLRGMESEGSFSVGVRRDELVEFARLRVTFTLSPSLLPALSHLKVLLNDELLQTVVLNKDQLGVPQMVDLEIDPRYFTDYNRFRFQFIGHYTMECETPSHTSLWASVSNESTLVLSLRQLPQRDDLALLPAPFFDPRDNQPLQLAFVYPKQPSMAVLKASGSVASWMGMLADYRGNHFSVFEDQLPQRHAVVFATNDQRPAFLHDLPPITQPTLTMLAHPTVPGAKLLLVLGKDAAQLQMAADALALGKAALSGSSMTVTALKYPPPTRPYDAPRWLTSERPVHLAELVQNASALQVRGAALNDTVNIATRMAPDLFTWNAKGVPLDLKYRHTPGSDADPGTLNVSINNQFIQSYPLASRGMQPSGKNKVLLPLFDDSNVQARSNLQIPAFMLGGDNQLQFSFEIPPNDMGHCRSTQPSERVATIDPQSTIDLTGFHHYLAMPNLAAYANSGFPFTRVPDLAQTSVILPNQPTIADIQVFLTAISRMSASTGYPGTRFQLLTAAQIKQAGDTDILLVAQGDRDGLLAQWQQHLPALVAAGSRSVASLERTMGSFIQLFQLESEIQLSSSGGRTTLTGDGPLAAIVGFESPVQKGRSVVALTASDSAAMALVSSGLSDSGKIQLLRGDLGLLRGDAIESFRIHPVYYVGDLPWWQWLWFHLHSHPLLLALLGIGAGLLVTFIVYGALRAMAARRLRGDHG
ncbi:cellulose biosynthesis cyclic di-GMP-binding regulatory protein BcsB [Simplicispira psychrophila]|uniref:cellulose biosynthesis cyclic di-GMP-binding regulatory protein BcsB n=1 Tax=Simplicispira psychrophila TaxID=80882 RepID=UPI001FE1E055|nr:cellulose biosynthesis cyclic di-GMP-binding regulatory protein BcsB [Simplicispira psychrophila]